jgi:hypothetical protein
VAKFFHPADEPGIHAACSCGVFIGTPQSKGIDGWHGATATSTEAAPTAQPIHAGRCKPSKIRDVDFATKPGHIECVLDLIARWIGARSDPLMTTKTTTRPPNRPALRHPLDSEEAARALGTAAGEGGRASPNRLTEVTNVVYVAIGIQPKSGSRRSEVARQALAGDPEPLLGSGPDGI